MEINIIGLVESIYQKQCEQKNIKNQYQFALLNETNIKDILSVQKSIFNDLGNPTLLKETTVSDWNKILSNKRDITIGIYHNNELIGYTTLQFPKSHFHVYRKRFLISCIHKKCMYFKVIVIKKNHQGKGLHKAINETTMKYASLKGIKRVIATVHPDNLASNISFIKLGYILIKTTPVHNNQIRNIYELKLY